LSHFGKKNFGKRIAKQVAKRRTARERNKPVGSTVTKRIGSPMTKVSNKLAMDIAR
jgi:hypothetical protein